MELFFRQSVFRPGADRLSDGNDDDPRGMSTGRAKKAPAMVNPEIDEVDVSDGRKKRTTTRKFRKKKRER